MMYQNLTCLHLLKTKYEGGKVSGVECKYFTGCRR